MEGKIIEYTYTFQLPDYYVQEFERVLAKLELSSLQRWEIREFDGKFVAKYPELIDLGKLRQLAFFKEIWIDGPSFRKKLVPDQAILEKSSPIARQSKSVSDVARFIPLLDKVEPRRKESQYLTHSLHPYKGRFYPQMIRALINFTGIKKGDLLLDPFCGCGTTLLESFLMDINSIGVDLHPLACFIARVKIHCLNLDHPKLQREITKLIYTIRSEEARIKKMSLDSYLGMHKISDLPSLPDMPNIDKWFSLDVLVKIQIIMKCINEIDDTKIRDLTKIVFSSILRPISNWDMRQVRVRLLKEPRKNVPVFDVFEEKLWRIYYMILAYQKLTTRLSISKDVKAEVINADARNLDFIDSNNIDAIVTSPPYAMALPYIDTDRLSLFMLGFVTRKTINDLILQMIGNREIPDRLRREWESEFFKRYDELDLPIYFKELLSRMIEENNDLPDTAFRRKNMPALLYRYFSDMDLCLNEMNRVLKPGRYSIIIIGNNYTTTGKNQVVNIETDRILSDMATQKGWSLAKKVTKKLTPTSPPPLSKIRYESVLIFRKSGS